MATRPQPRFDVNTLRKIAGGPSFARGQAYYRDGQVELLSVDQQRVVARVTGSSPYRVELTGNGKSIDGNCTCPAFDDLGFCKHLVAVALTANDAAESGGATGPLDRIRQYLATRSGAELVEIIMKLVVHDAALFRELDMAAAMASDDDAAVLARFRQAIDDVTTVNDYVEYREVRRWASAIEDVLDRIAALIGEGRPALALELIDHARPRIAEAIRSIDDSNGHGGGLLVRAVDIHLEACRAVRPDPIELAHDVFERELGDEGDTYWQAVQRYADVLGDQGLAEYRRLALQAWEKLPPVAAGRKAVHEYSSDRSTLQSILDFFAERDGDVDARIALRAKQLSSPSDYLQLARFCHEQGRGEEALRRAEEGLWLFEDDRPDERLVSFTVDLLMGADRGTDAQRLLRQAFEREPSLGLYERLAKLGGEPARDEAIAFLRARLAKSPIKTRWDFPADLLVRTLMMAKMHGEAWAVVQEHNASLSLKEQLAKASEASHPREALYVYAARVDSLLASGGNPAYEEARRIIAHMATLRSDAEQMAYVAELKTRHKAKRNFMKLLNAG